MLVFRASAPRRPATTAAYSSRTLPGDAGTLPEPSDAAPQPNDAGIFANAVSRRVPPPSHAVDMRRAVGPSPYSKRVSQAQILRRATRSSACRRRSLQRNTSNDSRTCIAPAAPLVCVTSKPVRTSDDTVYGIHSAARVYALSVHVPFRRSPRVTENTPTSRDPPDRECRPPPRF